jgi:hypothetical protein
LIYKINPEDISFELTTNIVLLVKQVFIQHGKVIQGGLFVIHSLLLSKQEQMIGFLNDLGLYICSAMENEQDENSARFACGLVSDLANYLGREMCPYLNSFMGPVNNVLQKPEFGIDTKINAIVAVGDLCLATENDFAQFLDSTMNCLFQACQLTI